MNRPKLTDFVRGGLPDYWKYSAALDKERNINNFEI